MNGNRRATAMSRPSFPSFSPLSSPSPWAWFYLLISRAFTWLALLFYRLSDERRSWMPIVVRSSAHLSVLMIAIIAVGLSRMDIQTDIAWSTHTVIKATSYNGMDVGKSTTVAQPEHSTDHLLLPNRPTHHVQIAYALHRPIERQPQPHTVIPERPRLGVITYTVQPGDTVQAIAARFDLQPTTIMWADPAIEDAPDLLRIGQVVTILPVDGVYHQVSAGDTLESIAEKYKVTPEDIAACEYNHLSPPDYALTEGMYLIVPGGEKPYVPKVVTTYTGSVPEGARGTGRFIWPVLGTITQGYWYGHRAIDIGAPTGSAVLAADGGFVSFAGWTDVGYGNLVIVDHANGFATYYAHLSSIYVTTGQAVERSQVIGAVGSTGWSTGPHLHFEVRYYGAQQNPRAYLP